MKNKILSLVLCLLTVVNIFPVGALNVWADELLFYEAFDGYADFDIPEDYTVKGKRSRVEKYGGQNKAYVFYLDNSKQALGFAKKLSGDYFVGFDVITSDFMTGAFYLKSASAENDIIKFSDKNILAHSGKRISSLSSLKMTRIVFEADAVTNTYSVFANGKKILSRCYNTGVNMGSADGFGFWFKSESEAKVHLDNVFAGNGSYSPGMVLPETQYNPEALEETPVYEETVTDEVYFKWGFEEGEKSYGTFNQKDNILAQEVLPDGNGVCTFEKINAVDMHLDITDMSIRDDVSTSVVYQFDINIQTPAAAFSFALKDSSGVYSYPLSLKAGGVISGGGSSASLSLNKWHTVSLVLDWYNGYYRIYVDNNPICAKTPLTEKYDHTIGSIWRFHTTAAVGYGCKYYLDNLAIYGGTEPRDVSAEDKKKLEIQLEDYAIFASEEPSRQYLAGKTAYHTRSGVLWADGTKTAFTPKSENGIAMVPVEFFEKAFGLKSGFDSASGSITIGQIKANVNSNTYSSGSKNLTLPVAPKVYDGKCYIPLEAVLTDALGKVATPLESDEIINNGLLIISDKEVSLPETLRLTDDLNAFMFYLRPDAERIKADYESSALKGVHPRVLATNADFERLRSLVATDSRMKKSYEGILRNADIILGKELLKYELRDGVRLWYVSLDFVEHMETLGIAYHISGDEKYAKKAYDEMEAIANFPDWHPEHHIDVGALAIGYAIGYDWFYHTFTPEQREKLETAAYEQCFYLYANGFMNKSNDMKGGIIATQNHNQVMNAGSVMMGIAFADVFPAESFYLISGSVRATEEAIHHFAPNGSWYEGIGYGAMTLEYYSYMLSCMKLVFDNLYTLDYSEGTDRAAEFIFNMQSPAVSFGFNDGKSFYAVFNEALLWFADYYDRNGLIAMWYKNNPDYIMTNARAMLWYSPDAINADVASPESDIYYHGDEVVTGRDSWDGTMAFFGARGGRPQAVHGHMDVGSFVYGTGTTPWIITSKNPDYNGEGYWDYAGVTGMRWKYYTLRAEANNCIIINPDKNGEYDPNVKAKFESYESKPRGVKAVLNMTDSHNGKAKSAKRAYYLTDERQSLVVRDEISLNQKSEIYSFLYTDQAAEKVGNSVILTSNSNPGEKLKIEFMCSEAFEVVVDTPSPLPQGGEDIIVSVAPVKNRIYLRTESTGDIAVTVKLTPSYVTNPESIESYNVPIASWSIPDGELKKQPRLEKLAIDGVEYSTDTMSATARVMDGERVRIEAVSSVHDVEITESQDTYGDTLIKVTDKSNPANYSIYTVKYNVVRSNAGIDIANFNEAVIRTVEASSEPEPTNGISNLIDRNLSTRWSADGIEYALANLGEAQTIDTVFLAFHNGDTRVYELEIEVSEDGVNYTKVFEGKSSGNTVGYEEFSFEACKAKYVRVIGSGSSTNAWNSWNELVIGKRG